MMSLPPLLAQRLWQDIDAFDEEKRMPYVTSIERIGIAKGLEQGRLEGELVGQAALLERLLTRRFGPLPEEVREQLSAASREQLEAWGDRVLDAGTLAEVFGGH
jgi:hypothetical protein